MIYHIERVPLPLAGFGSLDDNAKNGEVEISFFESLLVDKE